MRGLMIGIVAAACLAAACGGDDASQGPTRGEKAADNATAPADDSRIAFETIDRGDQSGTALEQPQAFKLATEEEWEEFWSRHTSNMTPAPDLPQVDFPREMVIAAVDQVEPSGGFGLEITDIEDDGGRLVVRVSKQAPGPECFVTDALTQPFHIVRTAKSSATLNLVVSEETYDCG